MHKQIKSNPIRAAWMVLLLAAIVIALHADAQFKLPGKLPGIPNNIGGGGSRPGNSRNPQDLVDIAKKGQELLELNDPKRQQTLGQAIAVSISNKYPVSKERALNKYVNLVGMTVASVCPRPELNYAFGVLETNDANAFSTPGGYIFVTRGALNLMQDESELAGVLAHEVAHVVLNHGIEACKQAKMKEIADTTVQKFGQKYAAFNQFTEAGTQFVLVSGYSQGQEREADSNAIEYLVKAHYDPRGFPRFLQRLDAQMRSPQNLQKQLFATHPGTAQRIGDTTRKIGTYGAVGGATLRERFVANVKPK